MPAQDLMLQVLTKHLRLENCHVASRGRGGPLDKPTILRGKSARAARSRLTSLEGHR